MEEKVGKVAMKWGKGGLGIYKDRGVSVTNDILIKYLIFSLLFFYIYTLNYLVAL